MSDPLTDVLHPIVERVLADARAKGLRFGTDAEDIDTGELASDILAAIFPSRFPCDVTEDNVRGDIGGACRRPAGHDGEHDPFWTEPERVVPDSLRSAFGLDPLRLARAIEVNRTGMWYDPVYRSDFNEAEALADLYVNLPGEHESGRSR